jgi:hypothetical protein
LPVGHYSTARYPPDEIENFLLVGGIVCHRVSSVYRPQNRARRSAITIAVSNTER